ncbi:MAG TPA: hypothetical protein VKJ65_03650, partial [Phycisphaerae bacterium]|nr:hypothetical protein [Phycisphaerae bacterium]
MKSALILSSILSLFFCIAERQVQAKPFLTLTSSNVVSAGWQPSDGMGAPVWDGGTLLFHSDQGTLAITPLSDEVVRVHFTTAKSLGRDHSYAVVKQDLGPPA